MTCNTTLLTVLLLPLLSAASSPPDHAICVIHGIDELQRIGPDAALLPLETLPAAHASALKLMPNVRPTGSCSFRGPALVAMGFAADSTLVMANGSYPGGGWIALRSSPAGHALLKELIAGLLPGARAQWQAIHKLDGRRSSLPEYTLDTDVLLVELPTFMNPRLSDLMWELNSETSLWAGLRDQDSEPPGILRAIARDLRADIERSPGCAMPTGVPLSVDSAACDNRLGRAILAPKRGGAGPAIHPPRAFPLTHEYRYKSEGNEQQGHFSVIARRDDDCDGTWEEARIDGHGLVQPDGSCLVTLSEDVPRSGPPAQAKGPFIDLVLVATDTDGTLEKQIPTFEREPGLFVVRIGPALPGALSPGPIPPAHTAMVARLGIPGATHSMSARGPILTEVELPSGSALVAAASKAEGFRLAIQSTPAGRADFEARIRPVVLGYAATALSSPTDAEAQAEASAALSQTTYNTRGDTLFIEGFGAPAFAFFKMNILGLPNLLSQRRALRTKASEALDRLEQLRYTVALRLGSRPFPEAPCRFPRSLPATPARSACDDGTASYAPIPETWTAWHDIYFNIDGPHYFQLELISSGVGNDARITLIARADLDCNGVWSEYRMEGVGRVNEDGTCAAEFGEIESVRPLE